MSTTCAIRFVHAIVGSPSPSTGCAATYTSVVPNNASAMPTLPRMKYFHAASSAWCVRYRPTITTVVNVASSTATHIRPMLLDTSARFMPNIMAWNIAW